MYTHFVHLFNCQIYGLLPSFAYCEKILLWTWLCKYLLKPLVLILMRQHIIWQSYSYFFEKGICHFLLISWKKVLISPDPSQNLLFSVLLLLYLPWSVQGEISLWFWLAVFCWLVIMSIFQMLMSMCISSWEKCLFKPFVYFQNQVIWFLLLLNL